MFDIYIKDFNQNGNLVTTETLVQTIPAASEGDLKLISPIVNVQMGNAETFNFSIEGGTKFYDAFNQMKTFMRVVYDGDTIFYGRVLTIDNSFLGNRKIRLEGPIAFLNDTSVEGKEERHRVDVSTSDYLQAIINNHNTMCADPKRSFILGEVPGRYSSLTSAEQQIPNKKRKYGSDGWQDSKAVIEDLRSHYGGYLRVRCKGHKNGNTYIDDGHYLDWLNHYFNSHEISQTIEVGKNVLDITSSTEIDNIFTVVIPIGNSKTSTSTTTVDGEKRNSGPKHFYVPGTEVTVPSICSVFGSALNSAYHTYDDYAQAINKYGRIVKTVTFDDAKNQAELLSKCQEWIKNNYQGEVTKFTIKAVDMHQIGDLSASKIMVGDRVRIIYPVAQEDGSIKKVSIVRTCLSINYDLYYPENNSYTFGIPANILTKSYGVTKQGQSNKDGVTKPKNIGSGSGITDDTSWLSKVTNWLANHKIFYRHEATASGYAKVIDSKVYPALFPYLLDDRYRSYMKGPYNTHADYFYDTETVAGIGRFKLWKFTPVGTNEEFSQEKLNEELKKVEDSMKGKPAADIAYAKKYVEKTYKDRFATGYKNSRITLEGTLTQQHIIECKIIEYVKSEYGIDLTKFENTKMPSITFTDTDGITQTVEATDEGTIITKEMFRKDYKGDLPEGWHIVMTPDGREVASFVDEETGQWTYFEVDKNGNTVPTTIRDLTLTKLDSDKVFGSMISEKLMDGETMTVHTYQLSQAIENFKDGELVVARVEGDIVSIGNDWTKWSTSVARNINGHWLNPIEYVLNP